MLYFKFARIKGTDKWLVSTYILSNTLLGSVAVVAKDVQDRIITPMVG